jgi:hypothetical protein
MNVTAYLIAGLTLVYTVGQVLDFETWKPVIFINLGLIAVTLAVPFLHRFHELAGALSVAIAEGIGLFVLTYLLGRESGLHMQYFAAIGGFFVVLGLARLKLIIALITGSFILHILAWALFQDRARSRCSLTSSTSSTLRPPFHRHRGLRGGLLRIPIGGGGAGGNRQAPAQHPAHPDRRAAQAGPRKHHCRRVR